MRGYWLNGAKDNASSHHDCILYSIAEDGIFDYYGEVATTPLRAIDRREARIVFSCTEVLRGLKLYGSFRIQLGFYAGSDINTD